MLWSLEKKRNEMKDGLKELNEMNYGLKGMNEMR